MPQRGCPAGPRPGTWDSEKAAISGDQLAIWTQEGRGGRDAEVQQVNEGAYFLPP